MTSSGFGGCSAADGVRGGCGRAGGLRWRCADRSPASNRAIAAIMKIGDTARRHSLLVIADSASILDSNGKKTDRGAARHCLALYDSLPSALRHRWGRLAGATRLVNQAIRSA